MWPETTDTAPNSPIARAVHSSTPVNSAQRMLGSVTRRNTVSGRAPRVVAAASSSVPCACIRGISSRATNGRVTKTVASTSPGRAKTIFTSCACSQWPNQPFAPNSRTNTSPEITGETENGRSTIVSRRPRPGNWNLAMHQEAASPNTVFSGTAIAATRSVSLMALSASGSFNAASAGATPLRSASVKTAPSGVAITTASHATAASTRPSAPGVSRRRNSSPCRPPVVSPLRAARSCTRLMTRSATNEASSIASPTPAAPA